MSTPFEQLSCQELVELVTDYLDGVLSPDDQARFEQHRGTCLGCDTYLAQMTETVRLAGLLRPDDVDAEAEQALRAALQDWSRSESPRE